MLSQVLGLGSV